MITVFFIDNVNRNEGSCSAVIGERDGFCRQILLFDTVSGGTSFFIAFELLLPIELTATVLCREHFEGVMLSAATESLGSAQVLDEASREVYAEVYGYISDRLRNMTVIKELVLSYEPFTEEQCFVLLGSVTDTVGVQSLFEYLMLPRERWENVKSALIFDRSICAAAMFMMAIAAREFSNRRELKLTCIRDGDREVLLFEFDGKEDRSLTLLTQRLINAAGFCHSIECDIVSQNGHLQLWICPRYADVGLAGVKRAPLSLRYQKDLEDDVFEKQKE